jgi:LL-diaminopimelate aminotransferase
MMDFFRDKIAQRLGGAAFEEKAIVYKFAKIKEWKRLAQAAHPDIPLLDLGVGEPDQGADPGVVEVLAQAAAKPENRFYADNGIMEFQEAAAEYLEKVYGLKGLDPASQIRHGIGSKPILALLPLLFINPGDITLTTLPGYPVTANYTRYLGGEVFGLPLTPANNYYPDFEAIPPEILARTKLLYLNYPNNPTGQVASREFYSRVVDFAHRHHIIVISDAAYGAITFTPAQPLSFLAVDGAMEVGVEVHSLSKAFNMTGWRLGFLVGDPKVIKAYGTVKDNTDSGQFRAIQQAGIYGLNHPEITADTCRRYSRRFNLLVQVLNEVGFPARKPLGTFYAYVPIPIGTRSGVKFNSAAEVAEFLIKEALISTVPWDDAGSYLRFSVTFETIAPTKEVPKMAAPEKGSSEAEIQFIGELKKRLEALELIF